MIVKHNDYLEYDIPDGWEIEDEDDLTSIFCCNGEGALTFSYYSIAEMKTSITEQICVMAKNFIDSNHLKMDHALILDGTAKDKKVLYGTGATTDKWFIKFWFIAKYPRVVFATYQSEKKTAEVKTVDRIIDSISFVSE